MKLLYTILLLTALLFTIGCEDEITNVPIVPIEPEYILIDSLELFGVNFWSDGTDYILESGKNYMVKAYGTYDIITYSETYDASYTVNSYPEFVTSNWRFYTDSSMVPVPSPFEYNEQHIYYYYITGVGTKLYVITKLESRLTMGGDGLKFEVYEIR